MKNYDEEQIQRHWDLLFQTGHCVEIRLFRSRFQPNGTICKTDARSTISGWFDDPNKLIVEASRLSDASAYITVNPVNPDLLARSYNRLTKTDHATSDEQINRLSWIFVDIDPKRPSDISSNAQELADSLILRDKILVQDPDLANHSAWGRSGNGAWILVRVDLPVAEADRVGEALKILAKRFNTDRVEIDQTTKNPSRVMALCGTRKTKGDNIPDRPWRFAFVDSERRDLKPLDLERWLNSWRSVEPSATKPANGQASHPKPSSNGDSKTSAYGARAISGEILKLGSAPNGSRNQTLNDCAFALATLAAGGEIDWGYADRQLYATAIQIGLTDAETRATIDSAYRAGSNQPRSAPKTDPTKPKSKRSTLVTNGRVEIEVAEDEARVLDESIEAIGADPDLYQRACALVAISRDPVPGRGAVKRAPNAPMIVNISTSRTREFLARNCYFFKTGIAEDENGNSRQVSRAIHVPDWLPSMIAARGQYPLSIRPLTGITETPTFRPDGTLIQDPGYDGETGLLYLPSCDFPAIPIAPTIADAKRCLDRILDLVCDFHFYTEPDRAVWLAALFTAIIRKSIPGPAPLFNIEANQSGTGKGLLVNTISLVATGRSFSVCAVPRDPEEIRKRITSILKMGDAIACFDNLQEGKPFGNDILDALFTSDIWQDRAFATHDPVNYPNLTTWLSTGNNVMFAGDLARRVFPCRILSDTDRPDLRTDFKYPNLKKHILENRSRIVTDCLTVILSHRVSGKPRHADVGPRIGSFESWDDDIRACVHWMTGVDPAIVRDRVMTDDEGTRIRRLLIEGWLELPRGRIGCTGEEALKTLDRDPSSYSSLREALGSFTKDGRLPEAAKLGYRLKRFNQKISGNLQFLNSGERDAESRATLWRVVETRPSNEAQPALLDSTRFSIDLETPVF